MAAAVDPRLDLATRVLALLDLGSFNATYKYAVLLGLLDLCLELPLTDGEPHTVTTRQLASKVLELYWPQAREYPREDPSRSSVLKQNKGRPATILHGIVRFQAIPGNSGISLWKAAHQSAAEFRQLLDAVEWTLIRYPLPLLQRVGGQHIPFLYDIAWDDTVSEGSVSSYQRNVGSDFNNSIRFKPGVATSLVALNGLLRPFIHREWCLLVAQLNELPESKLADFLFGVERTAFPREMRTALVALQEGACFYCQHGIKDEFQVDHFVPWRSFQIDAIENLVAAHAGCNRDKRDQLAASDHLRRWWARSQPDSPTALILREVAESNSLESSPATTRSVCGRIYRNTPDKTPLWASMGKVELADAFEIARAMA